MKTKEIIDALTNHIGLVMKGKDEVIRLFVSAFLTGGHVLIDDIPGVGKTTMVKALAKLIKKDYGDAAQFKRIQCTPDLLPYDITGVDVFNAQTQSFEFVKGPVFCDIFLADELNRTPPKVQSALLEVMEERQVTVGRQTYGLSDIFFTAATQNPVESLGTYPLPPAQLDRFMVSISIGYPDDEAALEILQGNPGVIGISKLFPIAAAGDIIASREEQNAVYCHKALQKAIIDICNATRHNPDMYLGASPRASLQFLHLTKTIALSNGRNWVEDKDIEMLAPYVLAHRCIFKNKKIDPKESIAEITKSVLAKMDKETDWSKDI
ncbi:MULTISPECIES: MoxR family ATPase [unclassified Treponema]|uniref:AAA family ATPase n=1 Tax=unclassified Treponema TaxID=2638727 RepID=UPI0020A5C524|nr:MULTISPECIES: MoxR family ATPase [unclassified Treponema]UTC66555.1 MoxR family ATPase [Treponema sp. OMZ 789]UTC69287.1 MoxR family ATPase [Treponema sp. OMZ 790]UTC72001.1 MoxR family ATPase [Treponema sp. OMZ 791]